MDAYIRASCSVLLMIWLHKPHEMEGNDGVVHMNNAKNRRQKHVVGFVAATFQKRVNSQRLVLVVVRRFGNLEFSNEAIQNTKNSKHNQLHQHIHHILIIHHKHDNNQT